MSNYDDAEAHFDELLAEQPARAMAWLAQVAAQQAVEQQAGPLIQQSYENGRQQSEGLMSSQIESAWHLADEALTAKYGNEWTEGRDTVLSMVEEHPELIPLEARLSAQEQANRLDFVFKSAREDIRQRRDSD